MKKYLVGGAVRDSLLNLPIIEKDWVITGSNPQEMLKIGYEQVGKDFPVFLHPTSHEEYALARTERKNGKGYTGFICYTNPSVTIEEDLYRRDLTINAMAYDMHGNLLDPYNGQRDIKLKLLRHVSDAFYEDPLRILRVARFAAKFKHMGFSIASETLQLMIQMSSSELQLLSSERIWTETKKALITNNPQVYFQILKKCGALNILFPEIYTLFTISGSKKWHLNFNNLGSHTMTKLSNISRLTKDLAIRFSILCCNLSEQHNSSKQLIISSVNNLCKRLTIPNNILKLSKIVAIYYNDLYDVTTLSSEMIIRIFNKFNCWHCPKNIEQIIYINKSHLLDHQCYTQLSYYQENFLRTAFKLTKQIKAHDVISSGFQNINIGKELHNRRINILNAWNKNYK
ncbi:multifunctional CCA protein [Candidatus Blochmanniella vafra str. BVAF]|uniref:CCA-adding enzyme n=1 Tax=Blochmanniella vafra (strain BVAF) TaxID=859654 RepID=E8Q6N2_BLOVB|nr:multifunctional CCA addition/repair protein [Candidatus Blochmannia vafer]ADV33473.1 multifunctional CCA protein [Candidatus Blochmannia vafer str. BVAF]